MRTLVEKVVAALVKVTMVNIGVRADEKDVKKVINTIIQGFMVIGSLSVEDSMVWGRPTTEVKVPKVFACFVYPSIVSVDTSNRFAVDVLKRDTSATPITYSEWLDAFDQLWSWRKSKTPEYVTLAELRKPMSLTQAVEFAIVDGCVHGGESELKYFPFELECADVMKPIYYNVPVDEAVTEMWRSLVKSI